MTNFLGTGGTDGEKAREFRTNKKGMQLISTSKESDYVPKTIVNQTTSSINIHESYYYGANSTSAVDRSKGLNVEEYSKCILSVKNNTDVTISLEDIIYFNNYGKDIRYEGAIINKTDDIDLIIEPNVTKEVSFTLKEFDKGVSFKFSGGPTVSGNLEIMLLGYFRPTKLITKKNNANDLLISKKIVENEYLEIPANELSRAVYVSVKTQNGYSNHKNISFEHYVPEIGYSKWFDGFGDEVKVPLNGDGTYGPIQGFPVFNGGRIAVGNGENVAKNKVYEANDVPSQNQGPNLAFNEDISDSFRAIPVGEAFVIIDLERQTSVNLVTMYGRSGTSTLKDFKIEGSNDKDYWSNVFEGVLKRDNTTQSFNINPTHNKYRYYKISLLSNYGANDIRMHDVRMFEGDGSEYLVSVQGVL